MASLLEFANAYLDIAAERFVKKTLSEKKLAFKYLFKVVPPTPDRSTSHRQWHSMPCVMFPRTHQAMLPGPQKPAHGLGLGKEVLRIPQDQPVCGGGEVPRRCEAALCAAGRRLLEGIRKGEPSGQGYVAAHAAYRSKTHGSVQAALVGCRYTGPQNTLWNPQERAWRHGIRMGADDNGTP